MKKSLLLIAAVALLTACNTETAKKEVNLASFEDSASYAVGTSIGLNLKKDFESQGVDSAFDNSLVIAGLTDAINDGDSKITQEDAQKIVSTFF
ncbi:MAG: FKBP-type peptidyl-prolyl cis-trans isomerase N-terminal domain-containing protein, partial [Flavobacteriales bacterium]|nr:FKBP-type peptidyl-prolyl cis-trans isomerase N-terminal domain-containing protein [Flavobacteriales bacterium]